jgi:formylmethanofuran dehydrogenase subunit E
MEMTIIISCDNCNTVLTFETWQHRINGKIYCNSCYKELKQ